MKHKGGEVAPMNLSVDSAKDTISVYGITYTGSLFRELAFGEVGGCFRIVGRADGAVTVEPVEAVEPPERSGGKHSAAAALKEASAEAVRDARKKSPKTAAGHWLRVRAAEVKRYWDAEPEREKMAVREKRIRAEYERRLNALKPGDAKEWAALAEWCENQGGYSQEAQDARESAKIRKKAGAAEAAEPEDGEGSDVGQG